MVRLQDLATVTVPEPDAVVDDDAVAPVVDVADISLDVVRDASLHRRRKRPFLTHPEMPGLVGEGDLAEVVAVRAARDRGGQEAGSRRFEIEAAVVVRQHDIVYDEGPAAQPLADVRPVPVRFAHRFVVGEPGSLSPGGATHTASNGQSPPPPAPIAIAPTCACQ